MKILKYGDKIRVGKNQSERIFLCYCNNNDSILCVSGGDEIDFNSNIDHFYVTKWDKEEWEPIEETREFTWEERYEYLADKWVEHKSIKHGFKITEFYITQEIPHVIDNSGNHITFDTLRKDYFFKDGSKIEIEV
jgi:hypothetical protein